jgi:hypothetical protein
MNDNGSIKVRSMHKRAARPIWAFALTIAIAALVMMIPARTFAAGIDPSLIPDGTYPAHVDKVIDATHISVTMQGTIKADLSGAFGDKVKANDDIQVTLSSGKVTAFSKK